MMYGAVADFGFNFFRFDHEGDGIMHNKELGNIKQCIDPDCQA